MLGISLTNRYLHRVDFFQVERCKGGIKEYLIEIKTCLNVPIDIANSVVHIHVEHSEISTIANVTTVIRTSPTPPEHLYT